MRTYLKQRTVEVYEIVVEVGVRVRVPEVVGVAERGQHAAPHDGRHVGQPAARAPAHHHAGALASTTAAAQTTHAVA